MVRQAAVVFSRSEAVQTHRPKEQEADRGHNSQNSYIAVTITIPTAVALIG